MPDKTEEDVKDAVQQDDTPQGDEQAQEPEKPETPESEEETPETEEAPEQEESDEPAETEEKPEAKAEEAEPKPKTRKERRAERKAHYDSIRKERKEYAPPLPQAERYDPMDYSKPETDESGQPYFDPGKLTEDREKFAKAEAAKAAREAVESERFLHDQNRFWGEMELEGRLLEADPDFKFMDENSEEYDEDLVAEINDQFFTTVGYTEIPATDQSGQPIIDPNTGQQVIRKYVRDTGVSYEKFAKNFVSRLNKLAESRSEKSTEELVAAKSRQGVRPSGSRKGPKIDTPEDIAALSPEEFKANAERIEQRASQLFGN